MNGATALATHFIDLAIITLQAFFQFFIATGTEDRALYIAFHHGQSPTDSTIASNRCAPAQRKVVSRRQSWIGSRDGPITPDWS